MAFCPGNKWCWINEGWLDKQKFSTIWNTANIHYWSYNCYKDINMNLFINTLKYCGQLAYRSFQCPRCVLSLSLQIYGWGVLHDSLYRHLDELIKGVELLPHQTLLIKVWADDDPAGLLPHVCCHLFSFILLIQQFWKARSSCVNSVDLTIRQ